MFLPELFLVVVGWGRQGGGDIDSFAGVIQGNKPLPFLRHTFRSDKT